LIFRNLLTIATTECYIRTLVTENVERSLPRAAWRYACVAYRRTPRIAPIRRLS